MAVDAAGIGRGIGGRRAQPLLLRASVSSNLQGAIAHGERVTATAAVDEHLVLGTSQGAILVLDPDCNVLFRVPPSTPGPGSAVTALSFLSSNKSVLLVACLCGSLEMLSLATMLYSPLKPALCRDKSSDATHITCLAPTPDYDHTSGLGTLYYGTSTGCVVRRIKGMLFVPPDNVIFSGETAQPVKCGF